MKAIDLGLIAVVTFACSGALAVSIYPGVLEHVLFSGVLVSLVVIPVVAVATSVACVLLGFPRTVSVKLISIFGIGVGLTLLCGTCVALFLSVPRRIAFAACRHSFEELIPQVRFADVGGKSLNLQIGPYRVDQYAADPRGGVYFRVYSAVDGLGPDTMSYGFAFQPNGEGTPFGRAKYRISRFQQDWFCFRASDDY